MSEAERFPERFFTNGKAAPQPQALGVVIGGALSDGLLVRLNTQTVVEGLRVGSYVAVQGQTERTFFGYISDIELSNFNAALTLPGENTLRRATYEASSLNKLVKVKLELVSENQELKAVRSVPSHFAKVRRLTKEEATLIFGLQRPQSHLLGYLVDGEELAVYLDLQKLTERSTGVFGRSGTGKTFLTLPLLASIIQHQVANVLVFDMHNDYGYNLKGDGNSQQPGLKRLSNIQDRVVVVTLDEQSSMRRSSGYEIALKIGLDEIEPEDLEALRDVLNFNEVQINTIHALPKLFNVERWIYVLADRGTEEERRRLEELFESGQLVWRTFNAIRRKLNRLLNFKFITEKSTGAVDKVIKYLSTNRSVVVEFGEFGRCTDAYVLVANLLTRRIHDTFVTLKEEAEAQGRDNSPHLVIVVEEAHRFLDPKVANLTTFGTIAREMRKYNVTLLIVDQRPSQIDREVMSQIGTRITCALSDEQDINAVLTGTRDPQRLRSLLNSLSSKQEALVIGHAVRMPVLVRTRNYNQEAWSEYMHPLDALKPEEQLAKSQQRIRPQLTEDLL
ncbi:MAG: helicase HerA domain-containing protein [Thermoflexales bacterium]